MEQIRQWVDTHDELSIENNVIYHKGNQIGSVSYDEVSLNHGLTGSIIELNGPWLIVEGSRTAYDCDGRSITQGKFAVRPWTHAALEIDGPLP